MYLAGNAILTVGAVEQWNLPAVAITSLGLFLIALGSGGIKPCVAALGGDQFTLPQQAKQLACFFSIFYFSINFGAMIASLVTPIFRSDVSCLGERDCYPLAFGVPGILMAISICK